MLGPNGNDKSSVLEQLNALEQALADVRMERRISLEQPSPCADLVANKAAWERDEKALLERIASLKADWF